MSKDKKGIIDISKEELLKRVETLSKENYLLKESILDKSSLNNTTINNKENFNVDIKKQNVFLKKIIDSLKYPFYIIDVENYNIKMANSISGLKQEKLCYKHTHKLDRPCHYYGESCPIKIIKETKKPVTVSHRHIDNDGKVFIHSVHGYPIFDNDGNIKQIIEYFLDETALLLTNKSFCVVCRRQSFVERKQLEAC